MNWISMAAMWNGIYIYNIYAYRKNLSYRKLPSFLDGWIVLFCQAASAKIMFTHVHKQEKKGRYALRVGNDSRTESTIILQPFTNLQQAQFESVPYFSVELRVRSCDIAMKLTQSHQMTVFEDKYFETTTSCFFSKSFGRFPILFGGMLLVFTLHLSLFGPEIPESCDPRRWKKHPCFQG